MLFRMTEKKPKASSRRIGSKTFELAEAQMPPSPPPPPRGSPPSGLISQIASVHFFTPASGSTCRDVLSSFSPHPSPSPLSPTQITPPPILFLAPHHPCPQPKRLRVDLVLYSGGRDANSEGLGCEEAGVELAQYGRIKVRPPYCVRSTALKKDCTTCLQLF